MLITDQIPLELLNKLIVINNDRVEGYNYAAQKTEVPVLKTLFFRLSETSFKCKNELKGEVYKLGGKPMEGNVTSVDFFKAWLDIIAAIGKKDHRAILECCVKEEEVVMKSYEEALNDGDENITTQHQLLFDKHCALIKSDHSKVLNLQQVLIRQR